MKKNISVILIMVTLLNFYVLTGCSKDSGGSASEPSSVSSSSESKESSSSSVDSSKESTEQSFAELRKSPEGMTFYNEEKEPWGKNDFSVYTYDGFIIFSATELDPSIPSTETNAFIQSAEPGEVIGTPYESVNAVTYRGIAGGDSAIAALEHMNLPKEAVFTLRSETGLDTAEPFDINRVNEAGFEYRTISIYFNESFEVVDVLSCFPFTEKAEAMWVIQIQLKNESVFRYIASQLEYYSAKES